MCIPTYSYIIKKHIGRYVLFLYDIKNNLYKGIHFGTIMEYVIPIFCYKVNIKH